MKSTVAALKCYLGYHQFSSPLELLKGSNLPFIIYQVLFLSNHPLNIRKPSMSTPTLYVFQNLELHTLWTWFFSAHSAIWSPNYLATWHTDVIIAMISYSKISLSDIHHILYKCHHKRVSGTLVCKVLIILDFSHFPSTWGQIVTY